MPRAAANHWLLTVFHIDDQQAQLDEWRAWLGEKVTNKAKIAYVAGCIEKCPETSRVHGHVYIQLSCNVTFQAAKTWIATYEESPHIYSFGSGGAGDDSTVFCKGTSDDCREYVFKPETKLDLEPFEVGTRVFIKGKARPGRGTRTDLAALKEAIDSGKTLPDLYEDHFETVAKYTKFAQQYATHVQQSAIFIQRKAEILGSTLRPWQQTLWDRLQLPPDPRTILWYWEATGNVGKSYMAAYATYVANALVLPVGKLHDMCYVLAKQQAPVYIIDIPRTYEDKLDGVWALMEMIKNQRVCSYKYESQVIDIQKAHVVVFSNFEPNRDAMSADRYDVNHITSVQTPQ